MTAGQASNSTTNTATSQAHNNMSTNSMESDFGLAPVELPSWMLKDDTFSQAALAAATAAAANAVASDPASNTAAAVVGSGVETSPVWSTFGDDFSGSDQDPSPALSDSLTFDELLSSCDPSPLLVDDLSYTGPGSGLSDIPLFGNFDPSLLKEDHYQTDGKGKNSVSASAAGTAGPIGFSDFTLFPPTSTTHLPAPTTTITSAPSLSSSSSSSTASLLIAPNTSPAAPLQLAFGSSTPPGPEAEDAAQLLLRALTAAAVAQQQHSPSASASQSTSPVLMHTVVPPTTTEHSRPLLSTSSSASSGFSFTSPSAPAPTPVPATTAGNKRSYTRKTAVIGVKRRADAAELLPLDAPIQSRTYKTPSSTSRKDAAQSLDGNAADDAPTTPAAAPEDVIPEGLSAMESKRLSNTLAARRSRHRKAEELRILHDTIASLKEEVQEWKRRCMRAEDERDEIRGRC